MYLELFKLHELPFRLSPDPQFLYLEQTACARQSVHGIDHLVHRRFRGDHRRDRRRQDHLDRNFPARAADRRGGGANQSDAVVADGVSADRPGAIRLLAFQHEEAGGPGDLEPVPGRTARQRPQGAADRRRSAELEQSRARGSAHAVGNRDHQGKGAAHHSRRATRTQREAQFTRSSCSSRSACACDFT